MAKIYKGFRFDPELYAGFKRLASARGLTATSAFERFMRSCVDAEALIFPSVNVEGYEAEARVLVDWLEKGKRFYRGDGQTEVNISGQLLLLLPRIHSTELRGEIEEQLKNTVS